MRIQLTLDVLGEESILEGKRAKDAPLWRMFEYVMPLLVSWISTPRDEPATSAKL
jgi:hypothetical protein